MEESPRQQLPKWTAARSALTRRCTLSLPNTSFRLFSSCHITSIVRGRYFLVPLLLFIDIGNQKPELLNFECYHKMSLWMQSGLVVAASSDLRRGVRRSQDSELMTPSTTRPSPLHWTGHSHSRLTAVNVTHPQRTQKDYFLGSITGTGKGSRFPDKRFETLPDFSEINAMTFADPKTPGKETGVEKETHSTTATMSKVRGAKAGHRSHGFVAGSTAGSDVLPGRETSLSFEYQVTKQTPEGTANNPLTRRQSQPRELRAAPKPEDANQQFWTALYPSVLWLASGLSMKVYPASELIPHFTGAGQKGESVTGQQSPHVSHGWWLGIFSCFVGAFCGSLGDNMVRRSFMVLKEKEKTTLLQMWRSPLWTIGMFLTIVVNTCCSLIGLAFAPATVVTSFAGVHIFWNTLLAKTLNREKATFYDYIGIVAVVVGIVLIVSFSGRDHAIDSVGAFCDNLRHFGPVMYCLSVSLLIALGSAFGCCPGALPWCRALSELVGGNGGRGTHSAERFLLAATSGTCGGLSNVLAKATLLLFNPTPYAASSEGNAEGVSRTAWLLSRENSRAGWGACLLVALTGAVAAAQLLFLNASLRKFEAIYVVPTINSVLIVTGGIGGVLLFREVPSRYLPFGLGLISVVVGVVALSYGKYEAEQHLLRESQRKEAALRNVGGEEPNDPLLRRDSSSFDAFRDGPRREVFYDGPIPQMQGWCETLFQPLTDASVNILVRTNTLNANYPVGLLSIAQDSNANIRLLHHASFDLRGAQESFESAPESPAHEPQREDNSKAPSANGSPEAGARQKWSAVELPSVSEKPT